MKDTASLECGRLQLKLKFQNSDSGSNNTATTTSINRTDIDNSKNNSDFPFTSMLTDEVNQYVMTSCKIGTST
jgi:hypothetical protein